MAMIAPAPGQPMLRRPRLNALIREGLKHPLLVMLAAPGYGKTQAMADYVKTCDADTLWIHLTPLDNLPSRFWSHLLRMLKHQYPMLAGRLAQLAFPDTINGFDAFAQVVENELFGQREVLWVFDDFGVIDNQQIKEFIRMLAEANFELFHPVLLSNALDTTESVAFMTTRRALLLADDLRFVKNEIREYYRLYGIKLSAQELDAVERYTEGWPMPLGLMAAEHHQMTGLICKGERITHRVISHLFEERFFAAYPMEVKKLIIKLALLDSFAKTFVIALYDGNPEALEVLENHAFLINVLGTERYYFNRFYRSFLEEKVYLLTLEEERGFWQKAGQYFKASGDIPEAMACYRKSGDHTRLLESIVCAIASDSKPSGKAAAFYLEHLEQMPAEALLQNPIADCIRAYIYMTTLQLDKAEALTRELQQRLIQADTPDELASLGEVYVIQGLTSMMRGEEGFGRFFEQAALCLPDGSLLSRPDELRLGNNHIFFMSTNTSGAKVQIERVVHEGEPWMTRVLKGALHGMSCIFTAEICYLSYELEAAKQYAYQAIYEAEAHAQHDLVCNAHFILARIAFMRGDLSGTEKAIQSIEKYVGRHDIGVLNEIYDTVLDWYHVKLRDFRREPKSMAVVEGSGQSLLSCIRPVAAYCMYLICTGEYANAVGLVEHIRKTRVSSAVSQDEICLMIVLAIGYHHLGNDDAALQALWTIYRRCYDNGLIAIFIEADTYMRTLLALAREQNQYAFDSVWLDLIERENAQYILRANSVRAAHNRKSPAKPTKDNPLSKREVAILQAIAQGMTREEIALEQFISMNTVKSTITSIYNKLAANNKADAVSIAITKGYISGFESKY